MKLKLFLIVILFSPLYLFGQKPCPGLPTVSYAGKTYNTVKIGEQCWLKENLDVGTKIDISKDASNNSVIEKYCYNGDPANCTKYGGLYQWDEAMQYVNTKGAQGICPSGWHIPTYEEFELLMSTVNNDGNRLKAVGQGIKDGAGTNSSGFSLLLSGAAYISGTGTFGSNFSFFSEKGLFWSSSEGSIYRNPSWFERALYFFVYNNSREIPRVDLVEKKWALSVRCLKD